MGARLDRIILSNPSLISLDSTAPSSAPSSWVQIARTGSFVSNRYGKFSITPDDLAQMLHNFQNVTPKAPTELPVDFDHLSMSPSKPGDGIAAGWMKELALREDGNELWARVAWTPTAAQKIANQEYRFVSPSFVKDHTHKDGRKIGTTLLAAAITNHPFLENMAALTLYSFSALGDLALESPGAILLAEVGQRVMISPGDARSQDEVGGTFEISEIVGEGDDAFATLKDAAGNVYKWFRVTELLPASAVPVAQAPPLAPVPGAAVAPEVPGLAAAAPAVPGTPLAAAAAPVPPVAPVNPLLEKRADADALAPELEGATGVPTTELPPEAVEVVPDAPAAAAALAIVDALKQAVAAALAATPVAAATPVTAATPVSATPVAMSSTSEKGIAMKFMLRNDKNEEVEVTPEQLAAAGVRVVPEGSTVIPTTELTTMKATVTNLSERLDTSEKLRVRAEFDGEITRLLKGAFIDGKQKAFAEKMWGDSTDLSAFREWAATFTVPLLSLNKEHGSGGPADGHADEQAAGAKLLELSTKLVKEEGLTWREATLRAGEQLEGEVEKYREQYATP